MRGNVLCFVLAVAALRGAPSAGAAETAELRKLFPTEAELFVTEDGLSRLDLPVSVLEACKPDLSDLRIFSASGVEIPFFVDSVRPLTGLVVSQHAAGRVVDVRREELRRESGPPLRKETYDVELPREAPGLTPVELLIDVRHALFVARVTVSALPEGGGIVPLVTDGLIFRTGGATPVSRTQIELPAVGAPRIRIELSSEESQYLDPVFELRASRRLARPGRIAIPLRSVGPTGGATGGEQTTRLELARPRGVVPDLLRLRTSTQSFYRKVTVRDAGPGASDGVLGSATLYRLPGFAPIAELEIPIDPAHGDRLLVEIDDGDSPGLADAAFEAGVRQPSLVFSLKPVRDGNPAGSLCFGGGRAQLPRYDLGGLGLRPGESVSGKLAEAAARVHDVTVLPQAVLGTARPNSDFDQAPALAFAMRPGAALDAAAFSHRRSLRVAGSPEGLSKFELDPADLAVLRGDLGDLRIIDGDGHQWPYLLERAAAVKPVALGVEGPATKDHASVYRLTAPVAPLPLCRLNLTTGAPYLDRPFTLTAVTEGDGKKATVAAGRLARPVGAAARPLSVELSGGARILSMALQIEDGDDAPLAIGPVSADVQVPRVYLAAPEGEYALLLGAADATPPTYELDRARGVMLAVSASEVSAGPLSKNPDFGLSARFGKRTLQTGLFWGALVVAVLALAILTLRLARNPAAS